MVQTERFRPIRNEFDFLPNAQNKVLRKSPTKTEFHIDEALDKAGFGMFNYIQISLAGIILGAVLLETCGLTYIMPVSQNELNLTTQQEGILGSVSFFGIICSSHLWGFLADTHGRKRIIQPTLIIAFFLSICSSLTDNFYVFTSLRFLNGFFISGSSATIYAYLSEFHSNAYRNKAIMGSALMYGTMCVLMPVLAWLIINQDWQFDVIYLNIKYKPWRLFLIACSLPGLLSSFLLTALPESPKYVLGQGKQQEAIQILEKMHRWNGNKTEFNVTRIQEENESIENRNRMLENKKSFFPLLKSVWNQTVPLFKPPYLRPTLLICAIQFGIYVATNGFYLFFADILNRMAKNLDSFFNDRIKMCDVIIMNSINSTGKTIHQTKLELTTLEYGVTMETLYFIGFGIISLLIDRVGKYPILVVILGASGIGGIAAMFISVPALQIACLMAQLCSGISGNVINSVAVEIYPTSSRAMAICIALMFGRLGAVVGSNTAAFLLFRHCELTFYLFGVLTLVCLILAFFIPNIHQNLPKISAEPRMSIVSMHN